MRVALALRAAALAPGRGRGLAPSGRGDDVGCSNWRALAFFGQCWGLALAPGRWSRVLNFTDEDVARATEANAIADFVDTLLVAQVLLICPVEPRSFPRDRFSLGYLFGFTDGVLQARDIEAYETLALVALSRTFQQIWGQEIGPQLLGNALELQDDPTFENGKSIGLKDLEAWIVSKGKTASLGLYTHHAR